jgi:hypothetical protein
MKTFSFPEPASAGWATIHHISTLISTVTAFVWFIFVLIMIVVSL